MNDIPEELRLFRSDLLDAIDRDLNRRSGPTFGGRFRRGIPAAAAVAAASAAVVLGLTLTAASPPSAYAAAKRAVAATAEAGSGTITGAVTHDGSSYSLDTTEWNGDSIAVIPGDRSEFESSQAIELIDGSAYVEQPDGTWLHYASESGVGPKAGPTFELAHDNVNGNTADQILSLTTGVAQTTQPDGTTVYTGTIPNSTTDTGESPSDDSILRIIYGLSNDNSPGSPGGDNTGLALRMVAGADGFVRQVSLTYQQAGGADPGTTTWTISYGDLGSTSPIEPPASSTPASPVSWSPGTPCTEACGG